MINLKENAMTRTLISSGSSFEAEIGYSRVVVQDNWPSSFQTRRELRMKFTLLKRRNLVTWFASCSMFVGAAIASQHAFAQNSASQEERSYFAHIAAASHALRVHDSGEAQTWLAQAPMAQRGWEWHYLQAQANQASAGLGQSLATALSLSHDGQYLLSASSDRRLSMRHLVSGKELWQFFDSALTPQSVAFHPRLNIVAAAFSKHTVKLWDKDTGNLLRTLQGDGRGITALAWSPDGKHVAAASWNMNKERGVWGIVEIWDAESGQSVRKLEYGAKPLVSIAYSPDGRYLAVGSWEVQKTVAVWQTHEWGAPFLLDSENDGSYKAVQSISFSADSQYLAAGGKDGRVRVWELATRQRVLSLGGRGWGHSKWVNSVAFSPDRRHLASASTDQTVRLWDLNTGTETAVLHGHTKTVHALQFNADGTTLLSAGAPEIKRWDSALWEQTGSHATRWKHPASVYGLSLSDDGKSAYTAAWKGEIQEWDVAQAKPLTSWQAHQQSANALALSADQMRMASVGNDGRIKVWERSSAQAKFEEKISLEEVKGHQLTSVQITRDGGLVFAPSQAGSAKLWKVETGQPVWDLKSGKNVSATAISPNEKILATGSSDGSIQVWDAQTGQLLQRYTHHRGQINFLSFSPDSQHLAAAASDRSISQMHLNPFGVVQHSEAHDELVYSIAYSPEGQRLVSASSDQTVKLWDRQLNKVLSMQYDAQVYRAHFSPDGNTLFVLPLEGDVVVLRAK